MLSLILSSKSRAYILVWNSSRHNVYHHQRPFYDKSFRILTLYFLIRLSDLNTLQNKWLRFCIINNHILSTSMPFFWQIWRYSFIEIFPSFNGSAESKMAVRAETYLFNKFQLELSLVSYCLHLRGSFSPSVFVPPLTPSWLISNPITKLGLLFLLSEINIKCELKIRNITQGKPTIFFRTN